MGTTKVCSIVDCSKPHVARSWCSKHWNRWQRHGDPEYTVHLTRGSSRPQCGVKGCDRPQYAKGMCSMHRQRMLKYGSVADSALTKVYRRPSDYCVVEGCSAPYRARGYCNTHYWKLWKYNDPLRPVQKSSGRFIDQHSGYVRIRMSPGEWKQEHRIVMEKIIGRKLRLFEEVHHLNGLRADNRPENLELWCKRQPGGQRVQDLITWVIDNYMPEIKAELKKRRAK